MASCARRTLSLAASLAAASLLSACATVYDSAGNRYFTMWPYTTNPTAELQLNFPPQNPRTLQLGTNPDPFYLISPQPPVDPRITSPYSQAPSDPDTRMAAVGDNGACANRCESNEPGAPLALRADAGDGRRIASR
jgi:hypothetical protein